jgi:phospholipid/cholesterol/gamma-HCH transport system substrate-binding protein
VPVIPTKPSLTARLEEVLTHVLASVETTTHNLDSVFSRQNQQSLTTALANIAAITQTLSDRRASIDAALKNADRTMANAARVSGDLEGTLARIDQAAASFDAMSRQMNQTAASAGQAVTSAGADVQRFTNESLPQLENLMNQLSVLSESLRRLTEQTERNPKSLIFGKSPAPKGPGE